MLSSKLFTSTDCKNGLDAKMGKMPTQKAPLGHLLPSHPLIRSQLFCRGIFSSHFFPLVKYSIDKQAKFHDQGQTADGQFGKYIGLHFFPLRRLLVDNCVESSVNYKKIFGGFALSGWSYPLLHPCNGDVEGIFCDSIDNVGTSCTDCHKTQGKLKRENFPNCKHGKVKPFERCL